MSESKRPDRSVLGSLVTEYKNSREFEEKIAARTAELKRELVRLVKEYGNSDDKGHKWLDAGDNQIKHERRVSKGFNSSAAQAWAKEMGILDKVTETIEVFSEDKLLAYVWDNPDLQDKLDSFYEQKETWAFKVVEGKSYDDE